MPEQLEIEDFDTAKAVFEKLKDVPAERRKRILTWVAEGLGVILQAAPAPVATPIVTPMEYRRYRRLRVTHSKAQQPI